ncbi:uncharacterized protein [Salvelinus sp. IW2-2015]|uniref:uncharacterized protein n=1 Tax=Salvelinus sp. IW2-2015 TaxID=2691554 RepID=UPI000CDFEB59|nr:uncharacterized protein LOC111958296 [Salvelinus alpinus]
MSYHQGAEGGDIPKERQKDGSPYKDLDEIMDPHMSVHVHKTDFPTPSWESTRTLESDGELSCNLKHVQLCSASHMSMSDQSVNSSSIDPTDDGDQIMDERIHLERPLSPIPSYLSMKSMEMPIVFKEEEVTQREDVHLERAESPTSSYSSAKSHQSDEEDEEENSAPKEKCNRSVIRPEEMVCDVCKLNAGKSSLTSNQYYCDTQVLKEKVFKYFGTAPLTFFV